MSDDPKPLEVVEALFDDALIRRLPKSPCSSCGELLDAANNRDGHNPKPGDLTLCVYCGAMSSFTETLHIRAMTPEEFRELPAELRAELEGAQAILRMRIGARQKRGQS